MKPQLQLLPKFSFALLLFVLISASTIAQNYQWKSLPMGGAGFVSAIVTSKQEENLMYARTDVGGAYKWNSTTSTWTPLQDWSAANQSGFYGVESLAIDPRATNKLYMLVGISYFDAGKSAILKSDDYGQTFTTIDVTSQFKAHGNGMGRSNGERLQVDPNLGSTLYVGTRYNGVWKSTDAGLTWTRLASLDVTTTPNGAGISFVLIDPSSGTSGNPSQTIYVGVSRYGTIGDNLYKSTDGGSTFNAVTGGPAAYMPQRAVRNSNGDLIINYANGAGPNGNTTLIPTEPMGNGGIYKFTPSTSTWTNITPSGIAKAWGGISVDPNNPNRMVASTINNYQLQYGPSNGGAYGDRIYLTTNGGTSWTDVVTRGFSFNTNGIPWINSHAIHWAGSIEFDPFNTARVFITSGNGIFSNDNIDNAATQWKFEVKGLDETVPTDIASLPGGPLFTTIGDYNGFKYTDINQYGEIITPGMGTTTGIAYAGNNPNFLVRVGSSIYYSTDQGASWTATPVINGTKGKITVTANATSIVHCPDGSSTIYSSNNNGASWTTATNTVGGGAFTLGSAIPVADKVNNDKVYLYNNGSGNFSMSNTSGATFTVMVNIGGGGSKLIRTIPGMEGHIWVAMYGGGLKRSINSGTSFTTIANVTASSAVGYGKAAPGATYPTIYIWGTVNGVTGLFRSIDEGATWVRINDDAHQFGGPGNAQFVMGDMNTYGTVYMSTVGRGVIAGVDASILPVTLASLNVREAGGSAKHTAALSWSTLTESNASHFDIERSTNATSWINTGSVNTKANDGNSTSLLTYTYADDITGIHGLLYYRLKMIDKNGRVAYSNLASLNIGADPAGFTVNMYPNPVSSYNSGALRFTSNKRQGLVLKLVSADGIVLSTRYVVLQPGTTNINLTEITNKPAGIYTIQVINVNTNDRLGVVRFMKK